jgi:hypothetical protein
MTLVAWGESGVPSVVIERVLEGKTEREFSPKGRGTPAPEEVNGALSSDT